MTTVEYNKEFQVREKLTQKIIIAAEKYLGDIKNAAKYSAIRPIDKYEESINQLKGAIFKLGKTALDCANSYRSIVKNQQLMTEVMATINNYELFETLSRNVSQTKLAAIQLYRKDIQAIWREFEMTANSTLQSLLLIATKQAVAGGIQSAVNFVTTSEPDDFTTALTSKLLATPSLKPADKKLLQAALSKRLNSLFGSGFVPGYLSRHKLAPQTQSMSLEKLLEQHKPDTTAADIEAGKVPGETLVLVEYSTKNAIEFNVSRLISPEIIENEGLQLPTGTGLTKKVIRRYATTTVLPGGARPWQTRILPGDKPEMTIFESISPDKWRLLAKNCAELVTETSIRPQVYHSWAPPNQFLPAHQYVIQDIKNRQPAQPIAEYDFLARYLIDKFIKIAPDTAKKYKQTLNKEVIEKGLYAKFVHKKSATFEKEAAISYMLKMEPVVDLLYAEITSQAEKYHPNAKIFEEMQPKDIVKHLQTIYEQIITAAMNNAKSAHWLDDYDQTYKSVYLAALEDKAGYIKPQ